MIYTTTATILEQELLKNTKSSLVFLCYKYGIKGYKGKNEDELVSLLFAHIALLLGKRHEAEPPSLPTPEEISALLQVSWWDKLFCTAKGWISGGNALGSPGAGKEATGVFERDPEDPFLPTREKYNILALPFIPLEDGIVLDTELGDDIEAWLLEKGDQNGIPLQVNVYQGISCIRDFGEAEELASRLNADFVVWVDYYDVCNTELRTCVKYAQVNQVRGSENGTAVTESPKLSQIQEEELVGDIEIIILGLLGLRAFERDQWLQALTHLEDIEGCSWELSVLIGICYHNLGFNEKALACYSEAIMFNPQAYSAFCNRGLTCHHLEMYEHALADYDEAIRLDPESADSFINRGNTFKTLKMYDQALADYSQTIRLNPQHAIAFLNRGGTYLVMRKYEQALADFDQANKLDPQDALAFHHRGNAYKALAKNDQAIADYGQAIRLNPQDAPSFINRGNVYQALRKYDQAIADYDRAIILDPHEATAFNSRGSAYHRLQEYGQAIADYNQAATLNPHDASVFYNRGIVNKTMQLYDQAIADYNRAIMLDPQYTDAFYNRGILYKTLKKHDQAITDYEHFIRLAGSEYKPHVQRAKQVIEELRLEQKRP